MISPTHVQWALLRLLSDFLVDENNDLKQLLIKQGVLLEDQDLVIAADVAGHLADELECRAHGLLHARQVFDEIQARNN